jgi:dynein intermediate chain
VVLKSFESSTDSVFDASWHTRRPNVFASVDGSGNLEIWDLNQDSEVRTMKETKLAFYFNYSSDEWKTCAE